jgi:phenylacetic acid degradation operon negative regulatory protein
MMNVMRPSPKSLIFDLLSTLAGGTMPVGALVQAAQLFEIAENSLRVALARLLAAGQVERDERGRYRLSASAAPIDRRVRQWRRLGERLEEWRGSWIGVCTSADGARRRERALRWLGFRALHPGLGVRPSNWSGGVGRIREELGQLGLARDEVLVFELSGLDPVAHARACALWNGDELCRGYRAHRSELEQSRRRLLSADEREGMVESYLVGGRVIRHLALDPLLPEPIVPASERDALVDDMRRYDHLGRAYWAGFLERHGVLAEHMPLPSRGPESASGWTERGARP